MLVALIAKDKPGALEIRKANRDAHVAYLKGSGDTIMMAGRFWMTRGTCAAPSSFWTWLTCPKPRIGPQVIRTKPQTSLHRLS